jgi:hypothetical protein
MRSLHCTADNRHYVAFRQGGRRGMTMMNLSRA